MCARDNTQWTACVRVCVRERRIISSTALPPHGPDLCVWQRRGQQASLGDFRENVILFNQNIDFLVALLMSDKNQMKLDK